MSGRIRWGTSSWSEKAWSGVFYPAGLAAGEQLGFYATRFDLVEADVTYYRVPDRRLVEGWVRKTPETFTLAAKFPRSIVHAGDSATPDPSRLLVPRYVADDTQRFLEGMALLGPRLGPVVLQFPYFNRSVFARPEVFLERLDAYLESLPNGVRVAVELRNRTWIDAPLIDVLRRHRAALVWVDIVSMPHPEALFERVDAFTTDFVYARLIGDRRKIDALTDRLDHVVLDQGPNLERWARLLRRARERVPETYVVANNHYAGYAPDTIEDLQRRVDGPVE